MNISGLGNPTLEVPTEINATVGKPTAFIMQASVDVDGDKDAVTIQNVSALPIGSNFHQSTGVFTWTPNSKDAVEIG